MKKYIFLLFFQLLGFVTWAQDQPLALAVPGNDSIGNAPSVTQEIEVRSEEELLRIANEAYAKGAFREAIDLYEKLLAGNKVADVIYYNLGNAYYKLNKIAPAILNYERALLLNPGDGDIRFNLEMARLKAIDKIDPVEGFFLTEWMDGLRNVFSTNQWAWIGIVSFLLLIVCLVSFFFSRQLVWKKVGFYAGIVLLVITIMGNVFSYQQKKNLEDKDAAIIFASTVTIKGSPDNAGTDIVVLHEGTKVFIKTKLGNWNEIVLENGTVGWIESKMIEII